jgi:hypothetical protein
MKRWILFSVLAFLLILFISCQKQAKDRVHEPKKPQQSEKVTPVAQNLERMIDTAVENFQKGEVTKGVELLLDGIILVKPKENWPDGFVNNIYLAKEHFQNGNLSMFSEDISSALALLQPPKGTHHGETEQATSDPEQLQKEVEPAPVAQIFAGMISSAKDEFKKGEADSGVVKILQALQLLTPRTE